MLFNSIEFLFLFLPIVLLGFIALQRLGSYRLVMLWLILSSLFFYGWWNPIYLWLLGLSITVNYSIARVLASRAGVTKSAFLGLGIAFNLALLGYFKSISLCSATNVGNDNI